MKRHRTGTDWIYQRRDLAHVPAPPKSRDVQPVIHVSQPADDADRGGHLGNQQDAASRATAARPIARAKSPARIGASGQRNTSSPAPGQRRFHISRRPLASDALLAATAGIAKKRKQNPAVFVERHRNGVARSDPQRDASLQKPMTANREVASSTPTSGEDIPDKVLKRPGTTSRARHVPQEQQAPAALPPSLMERHNQDLDKIAADMDQWVLNEIGANLASIEQEKRREERARFKPKAPPQRYRDRQPPPLSAQLGDSGTPPRKGVSGGTENGNGSYESDYEGEDDDDDWIIDEYIRIPASTMNLDVRPADVGVLVLDDDEQNVFFFGRDEDDDDELPDDEEDENGTSLGQDLTLGRSDQALTSATAESHYTADYPDDEVDSGDEYGRHPYYYRNANASDDEEFDGDAYDDDESDGMVLDHGSDDDAAAAERIRAFMKRNSAFP